MRKRIGDLYYWLYIISEEEEVIKEEYRYYFGRNRIEKELYDEVKLKIKNNTPAHIVTFKDKQYTAEDFDVKMRKELFQTFQDIDVMAFDEFNQDHIKELEVNWPRMIERNINMKTEAIFKAMGWLNEEK